MNHHKIDRSSLFSMLVENFHIHCLRFEIYTIILMILSKMLINAHELKSVLIRPHQQKIHLSTENTDSTLNHDSYVMHNLTFQSKNMDF